MFRRSSTLIDGLPKSSEKSIDSADDHDLNLGSEISRFIFVARSFLSLSETTFETGSEPIDRNDGLSMLRMSSLTVRLRPAFHAFSRIAETKVISFLSSSL